MASAYMPFLHQRKSPFVVQKSVMRHAKALDFSVLILVGGIQDQKYGITIE
jgi:hypothetical protein